MFSSTATYAGTKLALQFSRVLILNGRAPIQLPNVISKTLLFILSGSLLLLFQNCSPNVNFNPVQETQAASSVGEVDNSPSEKNISQTVAVRANDKLDILFVIDNSGSMSQEQKNLSQRISGFMNLIKNLDWQIGMTTTDPRPGMVVPGPDSTKRAWGNGDFRSLDGLDGSQFVLKSKEESLSSAQEKLESSIELGVWGSGDERGIHAVSAALNKRIYSPAQAELFRSDSALVVVLISDEDECSNGGCLSSSPSSDPKLLLKQIRSEFGEQKIFKFHSIIKSKEDTGCQGANTANLYQEMSTLTGGLVGSICESNYTQVLSEIGNRVLELVKSVNLKCEPLVRKDNGDPDVKITLQGGAPYQGGFKMQGSTITFEDNLPEGNYEISYACPIQSQ
ncbi:hypothetical protein GW916_09795 [bacterium]|nr:hypothetical protein [bacterium]